MRFCNRTVFSHAAKLASLAPPQPMMSLLVRGSYALTGDGQLEPIADPADRAPPCGDTFSEEDRGGELLHASDFADFKLCAEVLVEGSCHAPDGHAVTECPVQVELGSWRKLVRVVGARHWRFTALGRKASEPEPFVSMPLGWEQAFGGPGFARNPAGKGYGSDELPRIEYPDQPMLAPADRLEPAGLGPIHPEWPPRAGKLGTRYGASWRKKRAPFFADDFDWSFFNAAPLDQRLEGYLRGDEELTCYNLHPDAGVVKTRLPGVRPRAILKDDQGDVREIPLVLDTLLLELDRRRIHLSWRGVGPVREDDFADVRTVLVASETLAEARHPLDHYRVTIEAYEADPAGVGAALVDVLALEARARSTAPLPPEEATGNPLSDMLKRKLGPMKPELQEKVRDGVEKAREVLPPERRAELDEKLAAAAAAADGDIPPPRRSNKPGSLPDPQLRPKMRKVLAAVDALRQKLDVAADVDPALREEVAKLPEPIALRPKRLSDEQRAQIEARIAEIETIPHHPRLVELDPEYEPPLEPISTDEPGPGRDLREQDLTGRDLSGLDLRGARLDRAILTKAKLVGANLAGASLYKAILYKADLSEAELEGADLRFVHGAKLVAKKARLAGAKLGEAFLEDAQLDGADLSDVDGTYAIFTRASMKDVLAKNAMLERADFGAAELEGASLSGTVLRNANFEAARATRCDLSGADLEKVRAHDADFSQAKLVAARGPRSIWHRALLDRADLSLARLRHADFSSASLREATLYGADLAEARLYRIDLGGADVERANLFRVDARKAHLGKARLIGANLYEAKLLGASGRDADLRDAILTRSTLAED